jgi:hypothetical protein
MRERRVGRPILKDPEGLSFEERVNRMMGSLVKNLNEGALAEEARRKAEKSESPEKEVAKK